MLFRSEIHPALAAGEFAHLKNRGNSVGAGDDDLVFLAAAALDIETRNGCGGADADVASCGNK